MTDMIYDDPGYQDYLEYIEQTDPAKNAPDSKKAKRKAQIAETARRSEELKKELPWVEIDKYNGRATVLDVEYWKWKLKTAPMATVRGITYGLDGAISEEDLKLMVMRDIEDYVRTGHAKKIAEMISCMKIKTALPMLPIYQDRLQFLNGTLMMPSMKWYPGAKTLMSNPIRMNWDPNATSDAQLFQKQLDHTLAKEDQRTVQQYAGYMMLPTNAAQCLMIIQGPGRDGKNVIVNCIRSVLVGNVISEEVAEVSAKFGLVQLVGKLAFIDDDMTVEALKDTSTLKKLTGGNGQIAVEKKGVDRFQADGMFCRFLGLTNCWSSSLYDHSDGWYQRQILINVLPTAYIKREDRIPNLDLKIIGAEQQQILHWMVEGLRDLMLHDFHFAISERTQQALQELRDESDTIGAWINDEDEMVVLPGDSDFVSSGELFTEYQTWCEVNGRVAIKSPITFGRNVRTKLEKRGAEYGRGTDRYSGRKVNGFHGIKIIAKLTDNERKYYQDLEQRIKQIKIL